MAKLNVFVACPYALFPLNDYKKVYDAVGRAHNVSFKFADEKITNQHVLDKIKDYILINDVSLFDITGWNPNVALELGIAIGSKTKYYILLNTRHDQNKDVPSDIKGIDRIQYGSNEELEVKLKWLITQLSPHQTLGVDSIFESLKAQISEALQREPGLGSVRLAERVGEDKGLVQSAVKAMTESGELRKEGAKKGSKYFVASGISNVKSGASNRVDRDIQRRICDELEKNPGLGLAKLASSIGQEKELVRASLQALLQAKKLKFRGERKGRIYFTKDTNLRTMRRI